MSQDQPPYQPPYTPPPTPPGYPYPYPYPYLNPYAPDILKPARRASVMMFILGGLCLFGGFCFGVTGAAIPRLLEQHPEIMQDFPPELSPQILQHRIILQAVLTFGWGVVTLLLAIFVRRGKPGPLLVAIILAVLTLLYLAFNLLSAILLGSQKDPATALFSGCFALVPIALTILLLVWLIQAFRSAPPKS